MKDKLYLMLAFLLDRGAESVTYAGLIGALGLLGYHFAPDLAQDIAQAVGGLIAVLAVLCPNEIKTIKDKAAAVRAKIGAPA